MNQVIAGDYKGQGVYYSWNSAMITLPLFKTLKISKETVSTCYAFNGLDWVSIHGFDWSTKRGPYRLSIRFYNGKCCTLEVNKKIFRIIKSSLCGKNYKEEETKITVKSILAIVLLSWLVISFVAMLPQGYADFSYWAFLLILIAGTCFLIAYTYANIYMGKYKWDVVSLNDMMNEPYDLEDYFQYRDELIIHLNKMRKMEFFIRKGNDLTAKPSKLLAELAENENLSVHTAIIRMTAHYKRLVKEKGRSFSDLFREDIEKYESRLSEENRESAKLCITILEKYERVAGKIEETDEMGGHEFEHWCAGLLEKNGFSGVEVTKGSNDQGVDIIAVKEGIRYAVQCKCYSSDLGNKPVQEVHAGKNMYHCQMGVVMTNRHFTAGAKELAEATGVLLWDRDKLEEMLGQAVE